MSDGIDEKPNIGVLIVTWNRRDDVLECLDSVMMSDYPALEIYVVDNCSSDGTAAAITEKHPEVNLIRAESNLGFAGGNNLGLAAILDDGLDAIFLLNDDALVAPDAIRKLVEGGFQTHSIAVLSPKILFHSDPRLIWSAGGKTDNSTGIAIQRHYGEPDDGRADTTAEVDYAVGCAMMVKAKVVRQVGLMDTRYFMYYEETDWCRRIREAGYRITYVPESRVWHKVPEERNESNRAPYYFSRNRLLYLRQSGMPARKVTWIAISDILRSAVAHAVKGRTEESWLMIKGLADYYAQSFGKLEDVA